jgi:hypothetical protein
LRASQNGSSTQSSSGLSGSSAWVASTAEGWVSVLGGLDWLGGGDVQQVGNAFRKKIHKVRCCVFHPHSWF